MSRILAWGAWFLALFFFWLLLAGEWNRTELVAAAAAAAAAATLAEVARARLDPSAPPPLEALTQVPAVLVAVVVDFAIVIWALVAGLAHGRVVRGTFTVRTRHDLRGSGAGAARRRAWVALAATYSANAYVLEIDAADGTVLLHDLVRRRASEQPV